MNERKKKDEMKIHTNGNDLKSNRKYIVMRGQYKK